MKKYYVVAVILMLMLGFALVPSAHAGLLDWKAKGFVQGSYYPMHNEYDPSPGVSFDKRVVARYGLDANIELSSEDAPKIFLFLEPKAFFGNNRPQGTYNYSTEPIALNGVWGVGYKVTDRFQVRFTHSEWFNLGNYSGEKLVWNAVQIRYIFGN